MGKYRGESAVQWGNKAQNPPKPAAPTETSDATREIGPVFTPELIAKLQAECDRVAAKWEPVVECIADANAALAKCGPIHSPEQDTANLYYPLLFLVRRIEEYDNVE